MNNDNNKSSSIFNSSSIFSGGTFYCVDLESGEERTLGTVEPQSMFEPMSFTVESVEVGEGVLEKLKEEMRKDREELIEKTWQKIKNEGKVIYEQHLATRWGGDEDCWAEHFLFNSSYKDSFIFHYETFEETHSHIFEQLKLGAVQLYLAEESGTYKEVLQAQEAIKDYIKRLEE